MSQETEKHTAAEALYRFFASFEGFDASHPLGFEAEVPGVRRDFPGVGEESVADMAAVFMMEPTLTQIRRYVNGGGAVRGACTVSGRVLGDDSAKRHETAAFFAALAAYVQTCGERYEDGGRVGLGAAVYCGDIRMS